MPLTVHRTGPATKPMNQPQHAAHFDHLRGLAIIGVLVHHLHAHTGMGIPYLNTYGGLLGVQRFLCSAAT